MTLARVDEKTPAPECEFAGLVMAEYEGMMESFEEDADDATRALLEAYAAHKNTVCTYCDWYRQTLGERVFNPITENPDEAAA